MDVIIVRRGLPDDYYRFLRIFAPERGLEIIVDRRHVERRHQAASVIEERRRQDRRGTAPQSWDRADFVVVRRDPRPAGSEADPDAPPEPGLLGRLFRRRRE